MNATPINPTSSQDSDYGIVLFDGHCNLCSQSVDFLIRYNRRANLKFASLQSESGQRLLKAHGLQVWPDLPDSVVFIERGKIYTHSDAALHIARHLDSVWPWVAVFWFFPRALRDVVYRLIARNRYRWFGESETCRMPTPELLRRFLT
jgi:predicted DCC family thiol-disulfide oxidoreductase YuxK